MNSEKRTQVLLLMSLILILFILNYNYLDTKLQGFLIQQESVFIDRVIDGDTIVSGNQSIRLLGINTPERGEPYYQEAKVFLENLVLNKTIYLEFGKDKTDRYDRTLAYISLDNKNINLELVKNGYANIYFPSGRDVYYNKFLMAWQDCNENLCKTSTNQCVQCIELKEFDHEAELIGLYNSCGFDCDLTDWTIKDEGRKKYLFPSFNLKGHSEVSIIVDKSNKIDTDNILYWIRKDYVWTRSGDTMFLRDGDGKLVLWENY